MRAAPRWRFEGVGDLSRSLALTATLALAFSLTAPADVHAQHGTADGHLAGAGEFGALTLLGVARLTNVDDVIGGVAVDPRGTHAYVVNRGRPDCASNSQKGATNDPDAGVYVIDIADPANPTQVSFIPHSHDSRPGEGVQVVEITTRFFSGMMLVTNNEQCGKKGKGGVSLYDVTDPPNAKKLSQHFGDRGTAGVNDVHTAFAWDAGERAYVVTADKLETTDVDILDVTNPRRPRLIAEYDLNALSQVAGDPIDQPELGLQESSLHHAVVKRTGSRWTMLLSYGDGGHVLMDVNDPANATIIDDTDFSDPDPQLLESAGVALPPEGNAHQAEFTADDRFFIGTDEDFSPYRSVFAIDTGAFAGEYPAGEFGWTPPAQSLPDGKLNGPTAYGGYGCDEDPISIPPRSSVFPPGSLAAGEDAILVLQDGPVGDPSVSYAACFSSTKIENAQDAGYDGLIIANHHSGAQGGDAPDAYVCGGQGHDFEEQIPAACVGHRAFHRLFGSEAAYTYPESDPVIGQLGEHVTLEPVFDGWGYAHLFDSSTLQELDTYAVDEAHDESFAFGFGEVTVHEVATHVTDPSRAYLSYYSAGIRAIDIVCSAPDDTSTCELVEAGGYLDPAGNDFWGVETVVRHDRTIVLGSDRDSGLWVFEDTRGP